MPQNMRSEVRGIVRRFSFCMIRVVSSYSGSSARSSNEVIASDTALAGRVLREGVKTFLSFLERHLSTCADSSPIIDCFRSGLHCSLRYSLFLLLRMADILHPLPRGFGQLTLVNGDALIAVERAE
jgi:hypothetical protein